MGKGGFTLVETLVVLLILPLVAGALLVLAQTSRQAWVSAEAQWTSTTSAQRAMDRLNADLRTACAGTVAPCTSGDLRFRTAPACDPASEIRYQFDAPSGELDRKEQGNPWVVVAGGLTAFTPTCAPANAPLVQLELTAQTGSGSGASTKSLTSQVYLQNPAPP